MSQLEVAKPSSPEYAYAFSAMVAGVTPAPGSAIPNFYPGVSKVVGVVRTTAGGTVGQPYLTVPLTVAGSFPKPSLVSASATDTSIYTMYWINQVASSQLATILPC